MILTIPSDGSLYGRCGSCNAPLPPPSCAAHWCSVVMSTTAAACAQPSIPLIFWLKFVVLAMLLTGCAALTGPAKPDTISFDARAFALTYGKLSQAVAAKCEAKKLTEAECASLAEIDRTVTRQILSPPSPAPSSVDMDALMRLLMGAAKFAL